MSDKKTGFSRLSPPRSIARDPPASERVKRERNIKTGASSSYSQGRTWQFLVELLLIVVLCFLFAGSPTPSVNEPHYLSKAKHYWNPSWCRGDFFLESADAHAVFYWTFGWVTRWLPLPATAWLGRLVVWVLFAASWRSLVSKVTDVRWGGLLSAILLLPMIHYLHLSGEWLIGGVEAKGFAWPLVFWGLAKVAEGRWWMAWPLFGLASSFHILVGGWAVIATLIAWWCRRREDQLSYVELLVFLVLGGLLALPGLVPALQLTARATAEEMREASITYSFRRLSHHLVFYRFAIWNMIRFGGLVLGTWWVSTKVAQTDRMLRIRAVILGSLAIAAAGIAIDLLCGPISQNLRASLLRYYWFRTSDILVPSGAAIVLVTALRLHDRIPQRSLIVAILVAAWAIGQAMGSVGFGARSTALQQQKWRNLTASIPQEDIDAAWQDVCAWIRDPAHLPVETVFLTPTRQQTFKWFAERPDVVTWKDVPQDAASLNAWWERRKEVHLLGEWPFEHPQEFANVVRQFDVTHVVWPDVDRREPPEGVQVVYANTVFRVFQLPPRNAGVDDGDSSQSPPEAP